MGDRTKWIPPFEVPQIRSDLQARALFRNRVADEIDRAYAKHGKPYWGRHEWWGILKEEVDELWDEIKADSDPGELLEELIQVAAMCLRFAETNPAMIKELTSKRLP